MYESFLNIYFDVDMKGKSNTLIHRNLKRSRNELEEGQRILDSEVIIKEKDKLQMEVENLKDKIKDIKSIE